MTECHKDSFFSQCRNENHRAEIALRRKCDFYAQRTVTPTQGRNAGRETRTQEAPERIPQRAPDRTESQYVGFQAGEETAGTQPDEQPGECRGEDCVIVVRIGTFFAREQGAPVCNI